MKKRKTAATTEEEAPNGNGLHKEEEGEGEEGGSEAEGEEEAEGEDEEEEPAENGVASSKAEAPSKPVKGAAPSEEKTEAVAAGGDEED